MPSFPTEAELFPTGDLPPATAKAKFLQWFQACIGLLGSTGNAADARTALGATATGSAVFTAADAAAARTAIGAAAAASLTYVPVRQTALSGSVDANGVANFLSAGSGLAVNLAATTVPVSIAFSAGFGSSGAVDYVGRISADATAAWSSLTASSTLYLYIDRNTTTGALTYGFTSLAPNYGYGITKSTTNGQHTFRIDEMKMYVGNGSASNEVQRVFVGEVVTGAASVTSVNTYALRGEYESAETSVPAAGTPVNFNHNIGVVPRRERVVFVCKTTELGYSPGDEVEISSVLFNTSPNFKQFANSVSKNTANLICNTAGLMIFNKATGAVGTVNGANWRIRTGYGRGW